jgi:hypothetical protein
MRIVNHPHHAPGPRGQTPATRRTWAYLDAHQDEMRARIRTESVNALLASLRAEGVRVQRHAVLAWFARWPPWESITQAKQTTEGRKAGRGRRPKGFVFHRPKLEQRWAAAAPDLSHLLHRRLADLSAGEVEAFAQRAREILGQGAGRETARRPWTPGAA